MSALDIASKRIPTRVTGEINLVLIDSGMYEARSTEAGQIQNSPTPAPPVWSRQQYFTTAGRIDANANVILVNYDSFESVGQQVGQATEDFSCAPHAASDFLVKPEFPSRVVNVAKLARHIDDLQQFNIIGIAAREAGDSLAERCSTIVMLRDAFEDAGLHLPIHVFGAMTPLEILTYCLSGADVFDGLNWLRLRFGRHHSIAMEEAAFDGGDI